jgi:antirestriction protein ArdC
LLGSAPFDSAYWITYKQAQKLGGSVRKGERGFPCVFWKPVEVEDKETGEIVKRFILRYYIVFNVEQCEGIEAPELPGRKPKLFNPIGAAQRILDGMPNRPRITYGGNAAFYSPTMDTVTLPEPGDFESAEEFYNVAFHELGHSTGHESRLNRKAVTDAFRTKHEYSQEELVAEFCASFLATEAGVERPVIENSAAYIAHWKSFLKGNSQALVIGAAQGQKAAEYISNKAHAASPATGDELEAIAKAA